jgi:outer membrane protein OmpA-like peptidoglycan-associated protein
MWVEIVPSGEGTDYYMTVVVKELMKQEVTATNLFEALERDGHVALYINFDTGKSTIKPESQQIVEQVAMMMRDKPDLKLSVEGHTDNVGTAASNKTLSEERAKAVASAIAGTGIARERLSTAGFGQDRPVADNTTEEGRALNRRVELVRK